MTREHPFSPHRVLPLALVGLLAVVAFAALRGPAWYQRVVYPLRYGEQIARSSRESRVDPALVAATIHAESDFDPRIVSKAGAIGLMQVMPETAEDMRPLLGQRSRVTTEQLKDPVFNIRVGTLYLSKLEERYGDTVTVLAAYNAGAVNAERWARSAKNGKVIDAIEFPETRHYVEKVLRERDTYDRLYGQELR